MSDYQYLINQNEKVIAVVKAHYGWLMLKLLPIFITLTVMGFLSFWLMNLGNWGAYLLIGLLFGCILLVVKVCLTWYHTQLIITNKRIVDVVKKGFFGLLVAEASYDSIHEIYYDRKKFLELLFKSGSLHLLVADGRTKLTINHVTTPARIMNLILQLRASFITDKENLKDINPAHLVRDLKKIKKALGQEKFEEIINLKKGDIVADRQNNV